MRRVTARMAESSALQDDSAAPLATTQPTRSLPALKLWPIIAAVGLLVFVLMVDGAVIVVTLHFIGLPTFEAMPWTVFYFGHTGILLAALLGIALLGHGRFRDFGFKAPANNRYVHAALFFGVLFGIVMTAADYTHNIIAHLPPENFSLSSTNLVRSLTFEGLYGGTVEEILFRGLLMTSLMQRMSGRLRLGRFDVHVAGVIVAVLFPCRIWDLSGRNPSVSPPASRLMRSFSASSMPTGTRNRGACSPQSSATTWATLWNTFLPS